MRALAALLKDHDSSELSVTPVPEHPMPSSGLRRYCMHMVHRLTCRQRPILIKKKKKEIRHLTAGRNVNVLLS